MALVVIFGTVSSTAVCENVLWLTTPLGYKLVSDPDGILTGYEVVNPLIDENDGTANFVSHLDPLADLVSASLIRNGHCLHGLVGRKNIWRSRS